MSSRSRAQRQRPRQERARHLVPAVVTVEEAINRQPPPAPRPRMTSRKWAQIEIERSTPDEAAARDAQRQRESADRLWLSIAMASRQATGTVPLAEVRAWLSLHAPKTWERMQAIPKPRVARRSSGS